MLKQFHVEILKGGFLLQYVMQGNPVVREVHATRRKLQHRINELLNALETTGEGADA